MILSAAKELKRQCYEPSRNLLVEAWDIDRYCAYMAYINLSYYDIPAKIICGNPLLYELSFTLYTPQYYIFQQLLKEGKLNIPLCYLCRNEISGQVYKSKLISNAKLCNECYMSEQRLLLLEKIINNFNKNRGEKNRRKKLKK